MTPRIDEFWSHVEKTDGCWIWDSGRSFQFLGIMAHKFMWVHVLGREAQMWTRIERTCGNLRCVRPEHLKKGKSRNHSSENEEEKLQRFWSHVIKSDNCWEWDSPIKNGYGTFSHMMAYRYMWIYVMGREAPSGMHLHHICENHACVRPEHLELLDQHDHFSRHFSSGNRTPKLRDIKYTKAMTVEERFWSRVDKIPGGCWEYLSNNKNYPIISELDIHMYAHRFMWICILKKEAPKGTELHHKCHNPQCVNPEHLELMDKGEHTRLRWQEWETERRMKHA
jgi:HNH endonuclease